MNLACAMLGVALVLTACTSSLPNVVADSSDPYVTEFRSISRPHLDPLSGFVARDVTSPKNWRDLNKAQAKTDGVK